MTSICKADKVIDLIELGDKLLSWFIERDWDFKTNRSESNYVITAKKTGDLRKAFCANRALNVSCYHEQGSTYVKITQGSWTDNLVGNAAWYEVTGGAWLAVTAWSLRVEGQFKEYTQSLLDAY